MKRLIHLAKILSSTLIMMSLCFPALAKRDKKEGAESPKSEAKGQNSSSIKNQEFDALKKNFREGAVSEEKLWQKSAEFLVKLEQLSLDRQTNLMQIVSGILNDAKLPITAALFASKAIQINHEPFSSVTKPSWKLLNEIKEKVPLEVIMQSLADQVMNKTVANKFPPFISSDWQYYVGSVLNENGKTDEAIQAFEKLTLTDRHFLVAKYQVAIIHVGKNKLDAAEIALKTILNPAAQAKSGLSKAEINHVTNYAKIALARIYYEQKQFKNAVKFYRAVERDSSQFYSALFEQGWAFFLAGYPNHALGAMHSVESPFFIDEFNPEASILRAISYYWMCRYDESRSALGDFMDRHANTVKSISGFLERKKLSAETAYQLFEDLVTGVSEDSLGIPRNILKSAAEKDSMLLFREQYADAITEINRLEKEGLYGSTQFTQVVVEYLRGYVSIIRKKIGETYIVELKNMKTDFDGLHEQAEFLYVELLMSEKEQLLGKELHGETKLDKLAPAKKLAFWGSGTQSWGGANQKNEFWWDEIGYYIFELEPKCNVK